LQGPGHEAEGLWRTALTVDPRFLPALAGLGELDLKAGNAAGVARQVEALRPVSGEGAAVLDARWRLARGDHAGAAAVLEAAMKEFPRSVAVRVALSHVRLADGSPPEAIEAALRASWRWTPTTPRPGTTCRCC
jgi:thioredoxin-like negative regulator of GroEL